MEDVCHRVAILCDGRLCAQGTMRDLLRQPDACRITLPALSPERLHALLDRLPNATLVSLRNVDHFSTPKDFGFVDAALEFLGAVPG